MKKYIVYGGYVMSRTDRQIHYVNAYTTMRLYGLKEKECILVDRNNLDKLRGLKTSQFIQLRPDYTGKYQLSKNADI